MGTSISVPDHPSLHTWGIKSTPMEKPISKHPQFSLIQWNQSCSRMPPEHRARAAGIERATDNAEPMDMDGVVAEEGAEQEETIIVSAAHYRSIQ
jgi:hypothetical protein